MCAIRLGVISDKGSIVKLRLRELNNLCFNCSTGHCYIIMTLITKGPCLAHGLYLLVMGGKNLPFGIRTSGSPGHWDGKDSFPGGEQRDTEKGAGLFCSECC